MARFTRSDALQAAEFTDVNLQGARFIGADLSGVMMRGVDIAGADIDAPWLLEGTSSLHVNGVDVTSYVESELNRRFPGRDQRRATDPDGLRAAWATLERTWAVTVDRVAAMPEGAVDVSVAGEWSFAQTLRHLVMATDTWLGRAILEVEQPYHPLALVDSGTLGDGFDTSVLSTVTPSYAEVLDARADRHAADPDGLRAAWAAVEGTWAATLDRVAAMPAGTVDVSVADEWSFAQTLRHLVLATDMWLGRAILEREQPFHPLALVDSGTREGFDMSVLATETPSYAEVLEARADRVAMVRDFLAGVSPQELAAPRRNPHEPERQETVLSCLHVILEEEWEHNRYAVRDLDAIDATA